MVIYRLRNKVTGQCYIGSTRRPLHERLSGHRAAAKRGLTYPVSQAIRDHGWDNFEVEELSHPSTVQEMWEMEKAAIVLFKTLAPNGYNQVPGGAGSNYTRTPEQRVEASLRMQGRKLGPMSDEAKAKMAFSRQGAKNWRARAIEYHGVAYPCVKDAAIANGLSVSQMNRRLVNGHARYLTPEHPSVRQASGPRGYKHSDEAKARMSAARSGANHWKARQIEIGGQAYPSVLDAMAALGMSRQRIKTQINNGAARYLSESHAAT